MTYYVVVGRLHGDDEDTCLLIEAETVREACYSFGTAMWGSAGMGFDSLASGEIETNLYINHVVSSDRPIRYENGPYY